MRAYRLREQNRFLPQVSQNDFWGKQEETLEYRRFVRIFQSVNYVKD